MKHQLAVAASILEKVKLPKIPNEVQRLQDESMRPDPDVRVIIECISRNPKLFTKFLAIASYMSKKEVLSAKHAVEVLGTKGVFTIFFSSSIEFTFQSVGDSALIVNHAIKIATAMSALAEHVDDLNSSDAYLYGLLYNVGYVVLNLYDPDAYKKCYLKSLMAPEHASELEVETYGTSSSFIGVYVAKKWHVKSAIYSGILFQNSNVVKCPKGQNLAYELVNLLYIAKAIVAETEDGRYITEEIKSASKSAMECMNINNHKYLKAQRKVKQQTKNLESFPSDFMDDMENL